MEGVSSGVVYLECLFPHKGVAKHSRWFLQHLTGELRRMPKRRSSQNSYSRYFGE